MLLTRLSRTCLAALAVAALGGTLVTSDIASAAPRIDPGFGNGPVRVDPGFNRGPSRSNPVFTKHESGPKYAGSRVGEFQVHTKCRWGRIHNLHWREFKAKVCD
jgi:hypothetical protein